MWYETTLNEIWCYFWYNPNLSLELYVVNIEGVESRGQILESHVANIYFKVVISFVNDFIKVFSRKFFLVSCLPNTKPKNQCMVDVAGKQLFHGCENCRLWGYAGNINVLLWIARPCVYRIVGFNFKGLDWWNKWMKILRTFSKEITTEWRSYVCRKKGFRMWIIYHPRGRVKAFEQPRFIKKKKKSIEQLQSRYGSNNRFG